MKGYVRGEGLLALPANKSSGIQLSKVVNNINIRGGKMTREPMSQHPFFFFRNSFLDVSSCHSDVLFEIYTSFAKAIDFRIRLATFVLTCLQLQLLPRL